MSSLDSLPAPVAALARQHRASVRRSALLFGGLPALVALAVTAAVVRSWISDHAVLSIPDLYGHSTFPPPTNVSFIRGDEMLTVLGSLAVALAGAAAVAWSWL